MEVVLKSFLQPPLVTQDRDSPVPNNSQIQSLQAPHRAFELSALAKTFLHPWRLGVWGLLGAPSIHSLPLTRNNNNNNNKKLYDSPTIPPFRNPFTSSQLVKFSIQRRQFYAARAPSNKLNPVEIKSWMRQLPAKARLGPTEIVFNTALQYSVSWNVMETGSTSHDIDWNALLILHRSTF